MSSISPACQAPKLLQCCKLVCLPASPHIIGMFQRSDGELALNTLTVLPTVHQACRSLALDPAKVQYKLQDASRCFMTLYTMMRIKARQ